MVIPPVLCPSAFCPVIRCVTGKRGARRSGAEIRKTAEAVICEFMAACPGRACYVVSLLPYPYWGLMGYPVAATVYRLSVSFTSGGHVVTSCLNLLVCRLRWPGALSRLQIP
ncbi:MULTISPECIES: hypothetical protein [Pelosinus]|uniref:hypothetical protein n=1 Tax=Pelosinus TaxID=365348 RepID=UPI00138AE4B3|nr:MULTISPECIES: hypothetical protein [Pelosinus]